MKKLLLLALFLTNTAFAATNVETLKTLYEAATTPARVQDFPEQNYADGSFVAPPRNQCIIINENDEPYKYSVTNIIRKSNAYGPLIFERTNEKLVFGENLRELYEGAGEHVERVGKDMIVTQSAYRKWEGLGVTHFTPATMFVRKIDNHLVFKISIVYNRTDVLDETWWGYCYPIKLGSNINTLYNIEILSQQEG